MPHPERVFLPWQAHYLPEQLKGLEVSPWMQMVLNPMGSGQIENRFLDLACHQKLNAWIPSGDDGQSRHDDLQIEMRIGT